MLVDMLPGLVAEPVEAHPWWHTIYPWIDFARAAKLWQDKLEPQKHTIYAWINFAETVDASLSLTPVVGTVIFSFENDSSCYRTVRQRSEKENFNAPRGPDEVSEVWRAQSRISYSVLTALVWSDLAPWPGLSFTWISRVLEKSGLYALLLIHELLQQLETMGLIEAHRHPKKQFPTLVLWLDAGPHFCCTQFLSGLMTSVSPRFKLAITVNLGLEAHMKGDVDTYFAVLEKRIAEYEADQWLITPADFVKCFTEAAASAIALGLQEHFFDFLPATSRADFQSQCPLINKASLPALMSATHSWDLVPRDIRRRKSNSMADSAQCCCIFVSDTGGGLYDFSQ